MEMGDKGAYYIIDINLLFRCFWDKECSVKIFINIIYKFYDITSNNLHKTFYIISFWLYRFNKRRTQIL